MGDIFFVSEAESQLIEIVIVSVKQPVGEGFTVSGGESITTLSEIGDFNAVYSSLLPVNRIESFAIISYNGEDFFVGDFLFKDDGLSYELRGGSEESASKRAFLNEGFDFEVAVAIPQWIPIEGIFELRYEVEAILADFDVSIDSVFLAYFVLEIVMGGEISMDAFVSSTPDELGIRGGRRLYGRGVLSRGLLDDKLSFSLEP